MSSLSFANVVRSLALLLAALLSFAISPTSRAFEAPELTGRLVDQYGLLSQEDANKVVASLVEFEQETKGQMIVAILPTPPETIEEVGQALFDAWKPGDKERDDGLLLTILPDARKFRVDVGYGYEGYVNDARAGDVLRQMGPYFREKRYADGILHAIDALKKFVLDASPDEPGEPEKKEPTWWEKALGAGCFFFGFLPLILFCFYMPLNLFWFVLTSFIPPLGKLYWAPIAKANELLGWFCTYGGLLDNGGFRGNGGGSGGGGGGGDGGGSFSSGGGGGFSGGGGSSGGGGASGGW